MTFELRTVIQTTVSETKAQSFARILLRFLRPYRGEMLVHTIFLFVYYSIFSTCFRKLYVQHNRRNMLSVVSQLVARNAFTARRRRTKDPSQFRAPGAESRLHAPDNVPSAFVAFTGTSSPRDLGLSSSSVCHFFDSVRESARFFFFGCPVITSAGESELQGPHPECKRSSDLARGSLGRPHNQSGCTACCPDRLLLLQSLPLASSRPL